MKRTTLALALIIAILLISIVGAAYYVSVNHSAQNNNSFPKASPTTIPSPSPSQNESSTVNATFESPLSNFAITSPSNRTYSSNILNLNITGQMMRASNVELFMNYSLDGQANVPIPVSVKARSLDDQYMGVISGFITLPKLSDGSHSITVFGDIEANGRSDLAQATVYFTMQISG
jgi:hypothetical protein